jgi:hypothetical protein
MDNRKSTSLRLTQKFPRSWSCPCLPGLYTDTYSRKLTDPQTRYTITEIKLVGKEMPISRIVIAVPNATVVLLD